MWQKNARYSSATLYVSPSLAITLAHLLRVSAVLLTWPRSLGTIRQQKMWQCSLCMFACTERLTSRTSRGKGRRRRLLVHGGYLNRQQKSIITSLRNHAATVRSTAATATVVVSTVKLLIVESLLHTASTVDKLVEDGAGVI